MKKRVWIFLSIVITVACGLGFFYVFNNKHKNNINEPEIPKKSIKVKYVDDNGWVFSSGTLIHSILNKNYNIELSEEPEYLFFSDRSHDNLDYEDCIKIFYTEENCEPDFNLCDYAISFQNINYGDRHITIPNWIALGKHREYDKAIENMKNKHNIDRNKFLDSKTDFCSFVYSHGTGDPMREDFFKKLCSEYKKVNSGGGFLNNIGGPIGKWGSSNAKSEFESKHKFSIAFENSSHSGYTTEKLIDAFAAQTVPIYWGNPDVGEIFNTNAFINVHDYNSLDEVIERIKEIDNNQKLYLNMITVPALKDKDYISKSEENLEKFIKHIIDQPYEKSFRRSRRCWAKNYINELKSWRQSAEGR